MDFKKSLSLRALRAYHKSTIPSNLTLHGPGDYISDWIRLNNRYYEYDFLHFMRNRFDCSRFIDVGANIGNHCNYFMQFGSTGWAFEPSQANYEKLLKNTNAAFQCFNVALGNKNGSDNLITFESSLGNSYVQSAFGGAINDWGSGPGNEVIQVRTLDSFTIDRPTLIKIDVEGSELRVLEGALQTLLEYKPIVAIELHTEETLKNSNFPYTREEVYDFFSQIGYELYTSFDSTNHFFSKQKH